MTLAAVLRARPRLVGAARRHTTARAIGGSPLPSEGRCATDTSHRRCAHQSRRGAHLGDPWDAGRGARPRHAKCRAQPAGFVAGALALALAVLVLLRSPPEGLPSAVTNRQSRGFLNLPAGAELYSTGGSGITISSDGRRLAFVAIRDGARQVYVRQLDRFHARPVRGTETVVYATFAPDGSSLAFSTADRVLKRVALTDSLPETVTSDIDLNTGAAWGPDGRIIFGRDGALWTVPAVGGTPSRLTTLDTKRGEVGHRWPIVLPGGAVLFTAFTGSGLEDARH